MRKTQKKYNFFLVFHLNLSGKYINDEHFKNIESIFFTLLIFHLDISGKDINDEHP